MLDFFQLVASMHPFQIEFLITRRDSLKIRFSLRGPDVIHTDRCDRTKEKVAADGVLATPRRANSIRAPS